MLSLQRGPISYEPPSSPFYPSILFQSLAWQSYYRVEQYVRHDFFELVQKLILSTPLGIEALRDFKQTNNLFLAITHLWTKKSGRVTGRHEPGAFLPGSCPYICTIFANDQCISSTCQSGLQEVRHLHWKIPSIPIFALHCMCSIKIMSTSNQLNSYDMLKN